MGKIRIQRGDTLNVPIELNQKFDITGQENLVKKYEDDVMQQIINPVKDYEVGKFIHKPNENGDNNLYMVMAFRYFNAWIDEYTPQGFDELELFKFTKNVKNSFFKLDFYDSPQRERQKLQFTKIVPMFLSNLVTYDKDKDDIPDYMDSDVFGENEIGAVLNDSQNSSNELTDRLNTNIIQNTAGSYIIPNFFSNLIKNSEIGNVYVFKDTDTKDIDEFYFTCRFFNAKTGGVVRLLNGVVDDPNGKVVPNKDYYFKLVIDRSEKTYQIFKEDETNQTKYGNRVGNTISNALIFFEE